MSEAQLRQKAVSVMRGWVGAKKGSAGHQEIVDTYNSYTPHPRGHALTMNDAWCAGTVSAAAIRAGLTDIMPVECSCTAMIALYQALGRWVESDSYTPQPGDLIFYDWDDNGRGDCTGQPEHVGMVETVDGRTITVIEGNRNNAVARRTMTVNGRYIRGYGCPDYAGKANREEEVDMTKEEVKALVADEVAAATAKTAETLLEGVRREVAMAMEANQPKVYNAVSECPEWARMAADWAVKSGYIQGDGTGKLGLDNTKLWALQVMYNKGK